jgi:polysaccharide biosynthesis protein PslE
MQQPTQPFDTTNLRDLLTIVFKHKYKIIVTSILIFAGATVFALTTPKVYEAKSLLLIKFGREFLQRPEAGAGSGFAVPPETIIRGEISILKSRDLLNSVIKQIGIDTLYPDLDKLSVEKTTPEQMAGRFFEESVSVTHINASSLLQVSFTHPDPYVAAKVVNTLVEAFKDKHLEVFSGNNTEFLESQQKTFHNKLRDSESNLANFKEKNRVFSFEEQKTALIGQRSTLDTTLKTAQNQISELEQRIAFIKSPRWTVDISPEMRTQLAALQQRERELLEKYTESSRTVQNQRQEMQTLRDSIRRSSEEQRQIELAKNEGELSVVKARADSLKRQLGQIEGEIRALEGTGRGLQDLKREATTQEQNYQTYARKLEESLIMDDMDRRKMVAISVVEKASPSMMPKQQKLGKKQIVAIGFFGGIAAGIALAFLLEFMTPAMTTPGSAERRLSLPVMVAITRKE